VAYNLPLNNKLWTIDYSRNVPPNPFQSGPHWFFGFPRKTGAVSYIYYQNKKPLAPNRKIFIKYQIEATNNAEFFYKTEPNNTCDVDASVRIILIRNMYGEYNRWFSIQSSFLKDGNFTLSVPLIPSYWTSVFGKKGDINEFSKKQFRECLTKPILVGICFGGGCFAGHGVRMSQGAARFKMLQFGVI